MTLLGKHGLIKTNSLGMETKYIDAWCVANEKFIIILKFCIFDHVGNSFVSNELKQSKKKSLLNSPWN
jgi:hypothetical protein